MLGAVLSVLETKTLMQYLMRRNILHLIERDIAENQMGDLPNKRESNIDEIIVKCKGQYC